MKGSGHGLNGGNYSDPYMKEVKNTTKTLDQDCQCSGRDSNRRPPEYKYRALNVSVGDVHSAVQPVASRFYTDCPTLAPKSVIYLQPNSGLGRLHETSVTRSRTVGRTP
jgi:hypothetical protein